MYLQGTNMVLKSFLRPRFNRYFFIRLGIIVLLAYIFFGFICVPTFVKGTSMEPTYGRIGFNFCWRPAYWWSLPNRGDVVIVRYTDKVLYLKRIVAVGGDTIAFRNGKLYLNKKLINEPYVKKTCDWNLPERIVEPEKIYVVGDNRSMPMNKHKFGQISINRLHGAPLW